MRVGIAIILLFNLQLISAMPFTAQEVADPVTQFDDVPTPVWEHMAKYLSNDALIQFSLTNKDHNELYKPRVHAIKLSKLRKYCGTKEYLKLTNNSAKVFHNSFVDYTLRELHEDSDTIEFMNRTASCLLAMTSLIHEIGMNIDELIITLPSNTNNPELISATNSYLNALKEFITTNNNALNVIINVHQDLRFVKIDKNFEAQAYEILSDANMTSLSISVEITAIPSFRSFASNSNVKVLVLDYLDETVSAILPQFSSLSSLELMSETSLVIDQMLSKGLKRLSHFKGNDKQIITMLETSKSIKSVAFLDNASLEMKYYFGLQHLTFGIFYDEDPHNTRTMLMNQKPTLLSLSIQLSAINIQIFEDIIAEFIESNDMLRSLTIRTPEQVRSNYQIVQLTLHGLLLASNIESFTFIGQLSNLQTTEHIFTFIESHKPLKSIAFKIPSNRFLITQDLFQRFFTGLVNSIAKREHGISVHLDFIIQCNEKIKFIQWVGETSRILVGKGVILNGIEVDRLVKDYEHFALGDLEFDTGNLIHIGDVV